MCGIAGWIDYSRIISEEKQLMEEMTKTLVRRGPDAEGYWCSAHALFGHRRLVVVDRRRRAANVLYDGREYIYHHL